MKIQFSYFTHITYQQKMQSQHEETIYERKGFKSKDGYLRKKKNQKMAKQIKPCNPEIISHNQRERESYRENQCCGGLWHQQEQLQASHKPCLDEMEFTETKQKEEGKVAAGE